MTTLVAVPVSLVQEPRVKTGNFVRSTAWVCLNEASYRRTRLCSSVCFCLCQPVCVLHSVQSTSYPEVGVGEGALDTTVITKVRNGEMGNNKLSH